MGIFKRMKSMVTADIHQTLDRFEDPVSMLNQYLRELEEEIQKAQDALAKQLYVERKYELLVKESKLAIEKRKRQIDLALDRGEEEVARLAVQDKIVQEQRLSVYTEQFETIKSQTIVLVDQIKQIKQKYEELQNRRLLLLSRANVAKVTNEVNKVVVSFNPENAQRGFNRVEEEIIKLEAKANSHVYLATTNHYHSEFLETEVEQELKKLKEQREQKEEME
ncbi:PspA/IM30 family protein [Bacillus sp. BGMRC 2118]|nr:PspA/IM30 family protein [Bacillus sp. BGMRC 2118]